VRANADAPAWYALVSDTHIAADPATARRGEVMADNLRAVVADILSIESVPAGVVIDGDLAMLDGQAGDYRTLVSLLGPLRDARLPLHLALGNHDDRDQFRSVVHGAAGDSRVVEKHVAAVDGAGLRLVVLDSLDGVNVTPGKLGSTQLDWLSRSLDAKPGVPTLVFVHHNLSRESTGALTDTAALLDVLQPRRHVKAVFFGHTHVWDVREVDGLHWVNLPAVAYPFGPGQPLGWCRLVPGEGGATVELRCVGGDRAKDGQKVAMKWRE
jgi:3',5'-cyclic AMP phosphodiesterase CpdA